MWKFLNLVKVYVSSEGFDEWFGIQFPAEGDQILALDQLLASLECFPINENIGMENLSESSYSQKSN